jgi:hypothetical protein
MAQPMTSAGQGSRILLRDIGSVNGGLLVIGWRTSIAKTRRF